MLTLTRTAKLSASTHISLNAFLKQQRELWKAALAERIDAYLKFGIFISFFDQCKSLTLMRAADAEFMPYHLMPQRSVLNKLHKAMIAFFGRVKKGEKPGFPRFRGRNRAVNAFDIPNPLIRQKGKYWRLWVKGIGNFRFTPRQGFENVPVKAARVVVTPCRVTVQLIVENTPTQDQGQAAVGIDLGLKTCITLSNGVQYAKRIRDNNKIMQWQKQLAKAEKGSNSRRKKKKQVAPACQRIALSESNLLPRITTALVKNQSNKFYIEKLNITGMVKNHKLAKSRHEQTWGMFQEKPACKAENAGGWVRLVNPKTTSQRCHECQGMPAIKLTLADRTYRCQHCGYEADRDVNAAKNILSIGLVSDWPGGKTPVRGKHGKEGGLVKPSHHAEQYSTG